MKGLYQTGYKLLMGGILHGARLLFALLFIASLLVQTTMALPPKEWAAILPMSIWPLVLLVTGSLLFHRYHPYLDRWKTSSLFGVCSLLYLIGGLVLIVATTDVLRYDAAQVFRSAMELNANQTSSLEIGAYLYRYPHQLGLVSLERFFLWLSPIQSSVLFFFINLGMVLGINYANWKLTASLFADERMSRYTILLSFAFLPQLFHILFVYGLIPGLFFASFGLLFLLRFFQKKTYPEALYAIFFLTLAYWVRNNYIILLVAVALLLLLEFLKTQKKRLLLVCVSLFLCGMGANRLTQSYYQSLSQQELSGLPKIAWIAMGLQDTPNPIRQPGWYNHYVREIYLEKEGDYRAIEADARQVISQRLTVFQENPMAALDFFRIKFVTTWTESTFESIWSGPSQFEKQAHRTDWLVNLYKGGWLYSLLYQWTHAIILFIYGGVWLYVAQKKLQLLQPQQLYAIVYLAGGVLFHLIWETKSQYVYPYVYLCIPFAVAGWLALCDRRKKNNR